MTKYLWAYVASLLVFCALDFLWLGVIAKGFYRSQIGALILETPNLPAAFVFYLLYVAGIVIFAVAPEIVAESSGKAGVLGALFGLVAYATYDLSNLATLKGWTLNLALVDITWGTFATGVSAAIGCLVAIALVRQKERGSDRKNRDDKRIPADD